MNLIPGTDDVTCEASGFKTGANNGLVLQVDHTLRQDFKLPIGRASQTVTVSGQAQMLPTDNASIGGVVTSYFMQALPINGRDFTNLIVLNAGVTQAPGGGWIWASQSFANSVSGALTNAQKTIYMQCCSTNELVPRDMRDFSPRIGLAWRPTSSDRMVVHAGYGIFYNTYQRFYDNTNFNSNQLWTLTSPAYPTGTGFKSSSPLALSGLWLPPIVGNPFPSLLSTPHDFGIQAEWPGNHTPYSQQWGLDIQYALNRSTTLDVGYVGQHGIHEPVQHFFNEAYPPPVAGDTGNYLRDIS